MSISETVLTQVLDNQLRELSARILLQTSKGSYDLQGSGLLYLADDGHSYILTAAHVLEKFHKSDPVFVECYSAGADVYPDEYMFSVPLDTIWTCYDGDMPTSGDGKDFDEKDVAVIPLPASETFVRDWMKKRPKAFFIPDNVIQPHLKGHGYGYPNYSGENEYISLACSAVNKNISCDSYMKENHCIKWICEEKLSDDERHGLSGGLLAMHGAASVILISVIQSTYPGHDGKVTFGTDLYWIRTMLDKNGVPVREADLKKNRDIRAWLTKIGEYLEEDCKESLLCAAQDTDLRKEIKDRYKNILEKVFGSELSDLSNGRLHCVDYGCAEKQTAIRIAPSASRDEIENTLKSYHMEHCYPHMMLMAVTEDVQSTVIPDMPGHVCLSKLDIWDVSRLMKAIAGLAPEKIKDIFLYLYMQRTSVQGTERPKFLLPPVPNNSDHFIPMSRDDDILYLKKKLENQDSDPTVFISGIGGIGKTELAIQLAAYLKPKKGAYYLRYLEPLRNADGKCKEDGIRRTILHAEISGHTRDGRTDEEEYQFRMDLLRKNYKGALLIIDNFDAHGWSFGELRSEPSYQALTTMGIRIVFTTRYDLANAHGLKIKEISEENLLELMRRHGALHYATEEELKELIKLVGNHTLAVILMAKTLNAGNGMISAANIQDLLTNGPDPSLEFPIVESDQNSIYQQDTLFGHLQKLLTPAHLDPQEKEVLKQLAALPVEGENLPVFIRNLTLNKAMHLNNIFNALCAKGWASIDREARRVKMNPLLRCICNYELNRNSEMPQTGCGANQEQEVRI